MLFTVARRCLIMVQSDLKDYIRGCRMSFISYLYLILLIIDQIFRVIVALKIFERMEAHGTEMHMCTASLGLAVCQSYTPASRSRIVDQ